MNGRIIEIDYAKGWGRVELEDGRVLTFDTAACREGIPAEAANVVVELVPARLGGEKIGRLHVQETWDVLPGEFPLLATARNLWVLRDGVAKQAPSATDIACAVGETGYATIAVRNGVVGHSTAWAGSAYRRPDAKDERVQGLRRAPLRAEECAPFSHAIAGGLNEVFEDVHDPDLDESHVRAEDQRALEALRSLASRFGIDTKKFGG